MNFNNWDQVHMTNEQCLELFDLYLDSDDTAKEELGNMMVNYENYPLRRFMLTVPNETEDKPKVDRKALMAKDQLDEDDIQAIIDDLQANVKNKVQVAPGIGFIPNSYHNVMLHHCFTFAGDHLDIRSYAEIDGENKEMFNISIDMVSFRLRKEEGVVLEQVHKKIINDRLEYWEYLMISYILINVYILADPEKTVDVEEREVKERSTGNPNSKRSQKKGLNKVRLVRSYRLKKRWKSAVKKRIHEIKCLAWGVRGHFRHYKDGRVIFIKPYVKGKKRDEYQGKIYELFPTEKQTESFDNAQII